MILEENGRIVRGVGGLYEILLDAGETALSGCTIASRAKGNFRHEGVQPLVGDRVRVQYDDSAVARYTAQEPPKSDDGGGVVIAEILPRQNELIRPPMANLGVLFITFAAAKPAPVTETIDKLIAIAEHNGIEPVPVICKCDVDPVRAAELEEIYQNAGFTVFSLSAAQNEGIDVLRTWISTNLGGRVAAFAGASGVGKSTLLTALFPSLSLDTGRLSEKISRGRHTTRSVTLYPMCEISDIATDAYIADTPGFSMLDFIEFDFYTLEDLPHCFPEFEPYLTECRYTDCSHTKESARDCAVAAAIERGDIAKERHESYLSIYADLVQKKPWQKK